MNYYRRYLGDFMRDTQDLSPLAHGIYSMLLDVYYSTERPLPAEIEALARICRCNGRTQKRVLVEITEKYFPLNGDGFRHNKRADKEILKAQGAIARMSLFGKLGAKRRWDREPHRVPHEEPHRVPMQPSSLDNKSLNNTSPTRREEILNPLKKTPRQIEKPAHGLSPIEAAQQAIKIGNDETPL